MDPTDNPGYRSVSNANEVVTQGGVVASSGWLSTFLPSLSSSPYAPPEFRGPPPPPTVDVSPTPRTAPLLGGGLGLSAMDSAKIASAAGTRTTFPYLTGSGRRVLLYGLLGLSALALFFVPLGLYLSLLANNAIPSSSPDVPPSPGTGSATGAPSTPPSGTKGPLPSPSAPPMPPPLPPPSPQHTNDTLACASAAGAWLNASVWRNVTLNPFPSYNCRAQGPFPYTGSGNNPGIPHEGTVLPLPTDLLMTSIASACASPEVGARTRAAYLATPQDICYFYGYRGANDPALSTWTTQIDPARLWTFPISTVSDTHGEEWDPFLREFADTAAAAAAAAASSSGGGVCKWWLLAATNVWVNPRAVLQAVQGVPWDTAPLVLANFWHMMGFIYMSTAPSGTALFSQAAMRALGGLGSGAGQCLGGLPTPTCSSRPGCPTAYLWYCLLTEGGVIPIHLQNTDALGALTNNGVPLEPGPPYPNFYSYLTQPHQLATHFAWVENVNSSKVLWPAYQQVYGAWGLLRGGGEGGGGSSRGAKAIGNSKAPSGSVTTTTTITTTDPPPCAAYATSLLREFLEASRTAPTSATPLSLDLIGEVTVAACGGGALPLPLPSAATSLLFALAQVSPGDACEGVSNLLQNGWAREYAQQVYVFGPPPPGGGAGSPGCSGVLTDASFQGVAASAAGAQLLGAVSRALEGRGSSIAAYPWVFLGGDRSLVNPQALAGVTAGLDPDTPLALSFYRASPLANANAGATPPSTSMRPMGGQLLLSRAAVALVMPLLGTPVCPLNGDPLEFTPDGGALGPCLWTAGVLPVHTFSLDPLGFFTPAIDWALSQIQIQNGFGVSMIPGDGSGLYPPTLPLAYSFRHVFQQLTYCGCANLSSACNAATR